MRLAMLLLWSVSLACVAYASDGAIEINQACAEAGGCTDGDAPGLPVSLNSPGDYVLTSDIDHDPQKDGSAALISVGSDVTLDLNGFTLRSTSSCEPGDCEAGAVQGVAGAFTERVTVKNGRVVGVSGNCIWLGDQARVERVTLAHCALNGITVGANSIVRSVSAVSTGRNGLRAEGDGTLYGGSTFSENGLRGDDFLPDLDTSVSLKARGGSPSFCADALCGDGRPRYYITPAVYDSIEVLTACDTGFHMASASELRDMSNLKFDKRRGDSSADSGTGPPAGGNYLGWVRTGNISSNINMPGFGNCRVWSEESGWGTIIFLSDLWDDVLGWATLAWDCDNIAHVWCIED